MITQKRIMEFVSYDSITGIFYWMADCPSKKMRGKVAGTIKDDGYVCIVICGIKYRAHRLAWFYSHGLWPPKDIDHINGVRNDNRLINLREATKSQNSHNSKKPLNNASGFKGVHWHKHHKKWCSGIQVNGVKKHLGSFETPEEAHEAYKNASNKYHGSYANHG